MSERDDDGQALTAVLSDTGPAFPGTLRDWFAGQALAGISTSCADQRRMAEARWAKPVFRSRRHAGRAREGGAGAGAG